MATSEDEIKADEVKVDITLGHVARHCIFHACSVIEAAIAQVSHRLECVCVVCVGIRVPTGYGTALSVGYYPSLGGFASTGS